MRRILLAVVLLLVSLSTSAQTGSALLTWTPPMQNTDGSPLTNLAGWKVYRGSSPTAFQASVTLQGGSLTSYRWENLPAGTHYFVVTAVNTASVESAFSNVANKLIPGATPNPPTVPQPVTVAGPVFIFGITTDSLVRLEAGSVVAGRPCDPTQQIAYAGASYMRVNAASVTPFPGQQILAGFAVCQQ